MEHKNTIPELGIMIDCARNACMNVDTLKKTVDLCAAMGYKRIGLYVEDLLEVAGEPYFGYQRGRYSAAEIREVDQYALDHGIELRPYIQTLAHLNQIVQYCEYARIIDTDDILLAGDPGTERLLDHLLMTVSDIFHTNKVNIGMDEAHMLGLGKYLDLHGYTDRTQILMEHLEMVLGLCRKYHLEPQMWSDMFFRLLTHGNYSEDSTEADQFESLLPSSKADVPEGLELVYWDYYSQDKEHYSRMLRRHRLLTDHIAFAAGAWRWGGFTPNNRFSTAATMPALEACKEEGICSFDMTLWGDDGAECSVFALLPTLFCAAEKASAEGETKIREERFYDLTGYTMEEFLLLDIANPGSEDPSVLNNLSKVLLYNDPLLGTFDAVIPECAGEYFRTAAEKLKAVTGGSRRRFDYLFETQEKLCSVLELKADLGIQLRAAYQDGDREKLRVLAGDTIPELIRRLDDFYQTFRVQWMKESKSFGFEVQTVRIGGLKLRLTDISTLILEYLDGKTTAVEELETVILPPGMVEKQEGKIDPVRVYYNRYGKLVSTSRITW